MATVVDLCNLALARLGDRANVTSIDPPEGSAQADHCARFYPLARDAALEAHDWSFASVRVTLARLETDDLSWAYTFAIPNETLAIRAVGYTEEALFNIGAQSPYFEKGSLPDGTQVLLTNELTPFARITKRVNDPTRYPPIFAQALVTLLASYLAGPVVKGRAGAQLAQLLAQDFTGQVAKASVIDANQNNIPHPYRPSNMARRGVSLGYGQYAPSMGVPYWAE